jgi:hypothetical protein
MWSGQPGFTAPGQVDRAIQERSPVQPPMQQGRGCCLSGFVIGEYWNAPFPALSSPLFSESTP